MSPAGYRRNDALLESQGMASRMEIALCLLAARKNRGLSQVELARRAGWKPQFVARLESLNGRLPNLSSIMRYGRACGTDVGLLFGRPSPNGLQVIRALTLESSSGRRLYEELSNQCLEPRSSRP